MANTPGLDRVTVLPHDPAWVSMYHDESTGILRALGTNAAAVHHIGSTAIPRCFAKPIIDILVEAEELLLVDSCNPVMQHLGYQVMGEYGIPNRRYFRKDNSAGVRLYHVHVYTKGDPHIERHLAFRDFLIQNPSWVQKYSDLKRSLAATHPNSSRQYTDAKSEFVAMIDELASNWRKSSS
ncbi:MAG: GrpB family protein [Pirellula sp.]|nr:GrpB family protein [Pirellula sp.]